MHRQEASTSLNNEQRSLFGRRQGRDIYDEALEQDGGEFQEGSRMERGKSGPRSSRQEVRTKQLAAAGGSCST